MRSTIIDGLHELLTSGNKAPNEAEEQKGLLRERPKSVLSLVYKASPRETQVSFRGGAFLAT